MYEFIPYKEPVVWKWGDRTYTYTHYCVKRLPEDSEIKQAIEEGEVNVRRMESGESFSHREPDYERMHLRLRDQDEDRLFRQEGYRVKFRKRKIWK